MPRTQLPYSGMSLYSNEGERKYANLDERIRFLSALSVLKDEKDKTFCASLVWTGCRPSELLWHTAIQIDLDLSAYIVRSKKKRGAKKDRDFRVIPVPRQHTQWMNKVHDIREAQTREDRGAGIRLWEFCRTTAWSRTRDVCVAAGLHGIKASARGLRHGFGTGAKMTSVGLDDIQDMLGHEDIETTKIYTTALGPEQFEMASRMWKPFGIE